MHGYQRNPIYYPLTQLGQKPEYLKLQARLSEALPSHSSQTLDFESSKSLINSPNLPHGYAALDLNGDGQLQQDEFLYFSNGKSHITPLDMAKMLVKLDAQDGTLDGQIKRSSLDAAAEEAKGYFCQLDFEAVEKLPTLDERHITILRDHLYKAKRSIYATDGNYDPSLQSPLNKTNDLTILKTILQEAAQASQASIRSELQQSSPEILGSDASQWSPVLQKKWMAKFMTYINEIFLGGRIPLLPKASHPSINLSDSGHSYRIRDRTENQTFHTLALVAIGYYLGGTMAKAANIFHETLDPMDMINGKSAEDYRASDVGLKLGTLLRHGKMSPDTFADLIDQFLGHPDEVFGDYLTRSDRQIKWLGIRPSVLPEHGYKTPRENIDCWSKRWVQKITGVFSHLNPFGKKEGQTPPKSLLLYV